ncbi:MAG: DMT family transporter [Thiomicrorhabdus sp.]|nr:DMT family transporter [Thiomicrorhabdus sp.]
MLNSQTKGEVYAVSLTVIEAWFPVFASFSVMALGGLHAYFYSLSVAVFFLFLRWVFKKHNSDVFNKEARKNLALTSFYITSLFALTFVALEYTSATNVAIILFLQILFGFLFLGRKPNEKLNFKQTVGAGLMTLGALLILFPGTFVVNMGDLLVLTAAMIAPIANTYQKRARAQVSSETILLIRSLIALPFIYILARVFETTPTWSQVSEQWLWIVLTGFLVFFIAKILWIEAIYLLPITKVNALFAFAPLLTMGLAYWLLGEIPNSYQVLGILPVLIGGYLITRKTN